MLGYYQAHKPPLKIGFTHYILATILWMGLSLNLAWAQSNQDDQAVVNMPKQFASSEIAEKNTSKLNINAEKALIDKSAAPRHQSNPIKTINTTLIAKIDSSIIVKLDGVRLV